MTTAHFFSTEHERPEQLPLPTGAVILHGLAIDERGESVLSSGVIAGADRLEIAYDDERMQVSVGGVVEDGDGSAEIFERHVRDRPVVLEATTLGFPELLCAVFALIRLRLTSFQIIYVEPKTYARTTNGADSFKLSELIRGYRPIPPAVVDLSSDEVDAGVAFLGYEPERLERALEEYQMLLSKEIKVVFGVPAYQAGWELNAIVPHLPLLSESKMDSISYCSASNPHSAFRCLEETRQSLASGKKMFVAPIGTKPCGIASAIFAGLFPDQVGILYDHPRRARKRSSGVQVWHMYKVRIDY